jgi:hypothetical protein
MQAGARLKDWCSSYDSQPGCPQRPVDVHVIPPAYAALLASRRVVQAASRAMPGWSLNDALTLMDLVGIQTAMRQRGPPSGQSRYQIPDGDQQADKGGRDVLAVISSSLVRD